MNELFSILPKLLREFDDNEEIRRVVIFAAWKKIAGEMMREQAVPVAIEEKRLIIAVGSEIWKNHLEALGGQLIFKLNSAVGSEAVTFLDFRVDAGLVEAERVKNRRGKIDLDESARIAAGEITTALRVSAGTIKDESMRERFLLAAGRCLARKKALAERDR